jgi:hypothetical protein
MSKLILAVAMCGLLSACSDSHSGSGSRNNQTFHMNEVTDKSSCSGPAAYDSVLGSWEMNFTAQESSFTSFNVVMTVNSNSITLTNNCNMEGDRLSASITVPAAITDSKITILQGDSYTDRDGDATCSVSTEAKTINYSLEGRCLRTNLDGQTSYMVRSGY